MKARIKDIIDLLEFQTEAGQATNRPGQRRMVVSPYPYMIFYRICDDSVIIQRIRHTARRPIGG